MIYSVLFGSLILFLPLVYVSSLIDPVNIPRTFIGLTLVGTIFTIKAIQSKNQSISFTWFHILIIFFLTISLLSFPVARDQSSFIFEYGKYLFLFAIMLITDQAIRSHSIKTAIVSRMVTYACLFQCALGLIHLIYEIPLFVGSLKTGNHRFLGTMTHSNQYSIHLLMMFPFVVYGLKDKNKWQRIAAFMTIFASISMLISAKTRSVWVALPLGLLSGFVVLLFSQQALMKVKRHLIDKKIPIILSILAMTIFSGIMIQRDQKDISRHWKQLTSFYDSGRFQHWSHAVKVIKEHPIIGVGSGNWRLHYPKWGSSHVQRPHNDYLWVASESGIPSMLLWVMMGGMLLICLIRLVRIKHTPASLIAVLAIGISSFAVVSIFSFPKERPMHLLYFGIYAGVALGLIRREGFLKELRLPIHAGYSQGLIAFTLLFLAFFALNRGLAEMTYKAAITNDNLTARQSLTMLQDINQFFYRSDPMSFPVMYHVGMNYLGTGDFERARRSFEAALKTYPLHTETMSNLATLYELQGRRAESIDLYRKTLEIDRRHAGARLNLATLRYKMGHYEESKRLVGSLSSKNFRSNKQQRTQFETLEKLLANK